VADGLPAVPIIFYLYSRMNLPKISIVTPSFNQGQYLEATILSVLNQNYPHLEYIIIDGGSTDGSIEIIKKYEASLTYWISEKDHGQADAINKGLKKCTGEIFNWINSDDLLCPGALHVIAELYEKNQFEILAGSVLEFDEEGMERIIYNKDLTPENMILKVPNMRFHQPGIWLKTDKVKELGGLNIHYHYCFDWHLVIRNLMLHPKIIYTKDVLVRFRLHSLSKTVSLPLNFQDDNIQIAKELKEMAYFSALKPELEHYIIMKEWYVNLRRIEQAEVSKTGKIFMILRQSIFDIPHRWSRYTLGTVKNILRS
jgi:glycosyltransferase involved in cell wall biosynthesis